MDMLAYSVHACCRHTKTYAYASTHTPTHTHIVCAEDLVVILVHPAACMHYMCAMCVYVCSCAINLQRNLKRILRPHVTVYKVCFIGVNVVIGYIHLC